jgi:hypothetical protein
MEETTTNAEWGLVIFSALVLIFDVLLAQRLTHLPMVKYNWDLILIGTLSILAIFLFYNLITKRMENKK